MDRLVAYQPYRGRNGFFRNKVNNNNILDVFITCEKLNKCETLKIQFNKVDDILN